MYYKALSKGGGDREKEEVTGQGRDALSGWGQNEGVDRGEGYVSTRGRKLCVWGGVGREREREEKEIRV